MRGKTERKRKSQNLLQRSNEPREYLNMKAIKKLAHHIRQSVFRRLEAPGKNYEKTMINNMDRLYSVIRKG